MAILTLSHGSETWIKNNGCVYAIQAAELHF
jgi:hypothetical protein